MSQIIVSGVSDLDAREAGNGRSDPPMDVAMEMVTAVTAINAESAGANGCEPMKRNVNGTRRRRSEAWVAPSECRSDMERTIQQHAEELMLRHQTVDYLADIVEARAASEEAQRLAT